MIQFVSPETLEKALNINQTIVPINQNIEEQDEEYKKLVVDFDKNELVIMHRERQFKNFDEILALSHVVRDKNNHIIDDLHKTVPFMTKYEKTRILGKRVKQLNAGMPAFVPVKQTIIDNYLVAEQELEEKKIPLIVERPIPNGSFEYWKVKDLEILC